MSDQLRRLEQRLAERGLRGHIYVTADGPTIYSATTVETDRKTGQNTVVGPRPITEALGADAQAIVDKIAVAARKQTPSKTGAGVPPVIWNTNALVATGTTAAHALIMALHHPEEYDQQNLSKLATRAPCRNVLQIQEAFEEATGTTLAAQSCECLRTADPQGSAHNRANRATPPDNTGVETMFTQYANELIREGETPEFGVLVVRGIPRAFNRQSRQMQAATLEIAPAITGTRWDGMLAAIAEHLAWLHGHPQVKWIEEDGRFNDPPKAYGPMLRGTALASAPAAFIRHGAPIAGHELDARGGERVKWIPARSQGFRQDDHQEAARRAQ